MAIKSKKEGKTPRQLGYRMPAEWERHGATWIAWPHNKEDWPGKFAPIPWIYAEIVRLISAGERVRIVLEDSASVAKVEKILERNGVNLDQVDLYVHPTDRVWTRDSGPIFVTKMRDLSGRPAAKALGSVGRAPGTLAITDWRFNAWAKYANWQFDDKLPTFAAKKLKLESWQPHAADAGGQPRRFVLEGGSIDVNGAGSLLTTEECLLSTVQQRNPGISKEQIEATLCEYLGLKQILWLDCGIVGDDTHGHIDDTARFVNAGTIVACVEPNQGDPNHAPMAENRRRLRAMRDVSGKRFTIVDLPLPAPVVFDGQRLPASYANFYIANAAVLVPVFNDANDTVALKILETCFKDRPVVPVYCRDLVWGLGTLHCMTQQEPAG
jgi:agmatine deiminase